MCITFLKNSIILYKNEQLYYKNYIISMCCYIILPIHGYNFYGNTTYEHIVMPYIFPFIIVSSI